MARYVNVDLIISESEKRGYSNCSIELLKQMTDAVEIVRCKDCKKDGTKNCPYAVAKFGYTDIDFCSCGEKEGKK